MYEKRCEDKRSVSSNEIISGSLGECRYKNDHKFMLSFDCESQ